jgi:hypothetical protein
VEGDGAFGTVGVAQSDIELSVKGQEELVGVVVDVPHVLAASVSDPDIVVVDSGHDPWAVVLVERGERLPEVHWLQLHAIQTDSSWSGCLVLYVVDMDEQVPSRVKALSG